MYADLPSVPHFVGDSPTWSHLPLTRRITEISVVSTSIISINQRMIALNLVS